MCQNNQNNIQEKFSKEWWESNLELDEIKIQRSPKVWDLDKPGTEVKNMIPGDIIQFSILDHQDSNKYDTVQQIFIRINQVNPNSLVTRDINKKDLPENEGGWDFWEKEEIENYWKKTPKKLNEIKVVSAENSENIKILDFINKSRLMNWPFIMSILDNYKFPINNYLNKKDGEVISWINNLRKNDPLAYKWFSKSIEDGYKFLKNNPNYHRNNLHEIKLVSGSNELKQVLNLTHKYNNIIDKLKELIEDYGNKGIYSKYIRNLGRLNKISNKSRWLNYRFSNRFFDDIKDKNENEWMSDSEFIKDNLKKFPKLFESLKKQIKEVIKNYYSDKHQKYNINMPVDHGVLKLKQIYQDDLGGEEIYSENQFSSEWWNNQLELNEIKLINPNNITIEDIEKELGDVQGPLDNFIDRREENKQAWFELMGNHGRWKVGSFDNWLKNLNKNELTKFYLDLMRFKKKNNINENLQKQPDRSSLIKEFIKDCFQELNINDKEVKIKLTKDKSKTKTYAHFDPQNKEIVVYTGTRSLGDILRSLSHELVHLKQLINGELNDKSGKTGSPQENEANSLAGVMLRKFGEKYPMIFESKKNEGELLSEIKIRKQLNESLKPEYQEALDKVIKGFDLYLYEKGFRNAYRTKNEKATPNLALKINKFLHTKLKQTDIKFVFDPYYQTVNLAWNKLEEIKLIPGNYNFNRNFDDSFKFNLNFEKGKNAIENIQNCVKANPYISEKNIIDILVNKLHWYGNSSTGKAVKDFIRKSNLNRIIVKNPITKRPTYLYYSSPENIQVQEIKIIGKNQFPKNIRWVYKINDKEEGKRIRKILIDLGYSWSSYKLNDDDEYPNSVFTFYTNFPVYIYNVIEKDRKGIAWSSPKYDEKDQDGNKFQRLNF